MSYVWPICVLNIEIIVPPPQGLYHAAWLGTLIIKDRKRFFFLKHYPVVSDKRVGKRSD